jgi:hypothetical protein
VIVPQEIQSLRSLTFTASGDLMSSEAYLRRATAPSSSPQTGLTVLNRLDVVFPKGSVFSFPLFDDLHGSDVIALLAKYKITHYVICRNSASIPGFYDVVHCDEPEATIAPLIKSSDPFRSTRLSTLFVPNRAILSRFQQMALFVFEQSKFADMLALHQKQFTISQLPKRSSDITIQVRLPTRVVVPLRIRRSDPIEALSQPIYDIMARLYPSATLKDVDAYRFGTINGRLPDPTQPFESDPDCLAALRAQRIDPKRPQFSFSERFDATDFDHTALQYTKDLDLSPVGTDDETRALSAALSRVRTEVEAHRRTALEEDPVRARMRVSAIDPPLTTYLLKIEQSEGRTGYIAMKVELGAVKHTATGLSTRVPYTATAKDAIQSLLAKMTHVTWRMSGCPATLGSIA